MKRKLYTRREALAAFTYLSIASACTPIKILFADRRSGDSTYDITLRGFMETIVPGISLNASDLTSIFYDSYYPFSPYREILAEDLDKASYKRYNVKRFYDLSLEKRERIIDQKIRGNGIAKQLYVAAIWLSQLTIYTGNYNSEGECGIIDFKCEDSKTDSYPEPISFLGKPATINGNPS